MIVRFLDPQNQVVRKVSQHYEVNGPIADARAREAGRGDLLPRAGAAARRLHDGDGRLRRSLRQVERAASTVEVPSPNAAALRMSSLVLVKRGEKVPEKDRRADNPLLVNDVLLYPNLGEPVSKAAKELGFYFAAYPRRRSRAADGSLELLLDDKRDRADADAAGGAPTQPAASSSSGGCRSTSSRPGTYELRAV